jgi:D-hydroxyproline dehydrogenase subunit alpha
VGPRGVRVDRFQETSVRGVYAAGEPTGVGGVEAALVEGEGAGLAAAGHAGRIPGRLLRRVATGRRFAKALDSAFSLRPELRGLARDDTIVCRCEDVSLGAVREAASAREAKLSARAGMGACQGRVCGPALRFLFGWDRDSVRPPISPCRIGTLAADWSGTKARTSWDTN